MKIQKYEASWCAPCISMQGQIDSLSKAGKLNVVIEHFDIEDYKDEAKALGIRSIPTLVKFDDSGKEIARSVGGLTTDKLLEFLS